MVSSLLGVTPLLRPNEELNDVWSNRDPLELLSESVLRQWYNELVIRKEIYNGSKIYLNRLGHSTYKAPNGHYYCGENCLECTCCSSTCGPSQGCNCASCEEVEKTINDGKDPWNLFEPTQVFESWTWGPNATLSELNIFCKQVSHKQLILLRNCVDTSLPMSKLKAKIYVYARFLSLMSRKYGVFTEKESKVNNSKEIDLSSSIKDSSLLSRRSLIGNGVRVIFKFLNKMLHKCWQDGSNIELCSELIDDGLQVISSIKKPFLYDEEDQIFTVTEDLVIIIGKLLLINSTQHLSLEVRKNLLLLMLELAFQQGSLGSIINFMVVCLKVAKDKIMNYADLHPTIQKMYQYSIDTSFVKEILLRTRVDLSLYDCIGYENLLNDFIESENNDIMLQVVHIMKVCMHIVKPYQLGVIKAERKKNNCDLLVWGNLKVLNTLKEERNLDIKIASICCTELFFVILTLDGKIYSCSYETEALVLEVYQEVMNIEIVYLQCSNDGHFIALDKNKAVYTWRHKSKFEHLTSVPIHCKNGISNVFAGYGHFAALSTSSELFIWKNELSGEQNNKQIVPLTFSEFGNSRVVDVTFSQYQSEVIIVTEGGYIWSWQNDTVDLLTKESIEISKVYIAKYFYIVLSINGHVWRWGKDRFSKKTFKEKICLQSIEKLSKESVLTVSVGAYHCIALTQSYNVYCWGGLGGKEEDESLIREPVLLGWVSSLNINHIMAGPHQIFCWSVSLTKKLKKKIPFGIEIKTRSLKQLSILLIEASLIENVVYKKEFICNILSLIKLQFDSARAHNVSPDNIGFGSMKNFNVDLKNVIMTLMTNEEYNAAAGEVLESGWSFLFPSSENIATTITELMRDVSDKSFKHEFLLQLLMKGILQNNGLEELIENTLQIISEAGGKNNNDLVLYCFVQALLNISENVGESKPSVYLGVSGVLLKFQRLLFAKVFKLNDTDICWPARCFAYELGPSVKALSNMISFYMQQLQTCCKNMLASNQVNLTKLEHYVLSPIGALFHEFVIYMIILQNYAPVITSNCDGMSHLADLLDAYNVFNSSCKISALSRWSVFFDSATMLDPLKEKKEDNLCKSSEKGFVERFAEQEVTLAFSAVSSELKAINKNGKCISNVEKSDAENLFLEIEHHIAFLLGLHCAYLAHGFYPIPDEIINDYWLKSRLFSSGLNKESIFSEELLNERRFSVHKLLQKDPSYEVNLLTEFLLNTCQPSSQSSMINYPLCMETMMRSHLAALIRHCGLEEEMLQITLELLSEKSPKPSKDMKSIIKAVHKQKLVVMQKRQESGKSYSEICTPIITRCKFLCTSLNPCVVPVAQIKSLWLHCVYTIKAKLGYNWDILKWSSANKCLSIYNSEEIVKDICKFIQEDEANLDVLRKCFLVQVKRAKHRLIAGYLMQSLCIRQHLKAHVQLAMMFGWLCVFSPGGSVSNTKPDILNHIELVPSDDVIKLKEVYKGFENYVIKYLLKGLERVIDNHSEEQGIKDADFNDSCWSYIITSITLLCSSLMSGDVDILIQCGLLEKIRTVLALFKLSTDTNILISSHEDNYFDSSRNQFKEKELASSMHVGSRVVRGLDWIWDDQDGQSPSEGVVVSDIGTDGWVRVRWDGGITNSYRMGKDGKYDLQYSTEQHQYIDKAKKLPPIIPVIAVKDSLQSMLIVMLSKAALLQNQFLSSSVCLIANFIIELLKEIVEHESCSLGDKISAHSLFGFFRALCISNPIKELLSKEDFVNLIMRMFELTLLKKSVSYQTLLIQLQMLKQVGYLVTSSELVSYNGMWKKEFIKSLFKILHTLLSPRNVYTTDENEGRRLCMAASSVSNLAEEIVATLKLLRQNIPWKQLISLEISKLLRIDLDCQLSEKVQRSVFVGISAIVGVEQRICINGSAIYKSELVNIGHLLHNGHVVVHLSNSRIPVESAPTDIAMIPRYDFDLDWFSEYCSGFEKLSSLFTLMMSPKLLFGKSLGNGEYEYHTNGIRVFVSAMRIFSQISSTLFMKVFNLSGQLVNDFLTKALCSSVIQTTYDEDELQLAVLALSEKPVSSPSTTNTDRITPCPNFHSKENLNRSNISSYAENISSAENKNSHDLFNQLVGMGFSMDSIQKGFLELGNEIRPELLVAWLLEHPYVEDLGKNLSNTEFKEMELNHSLKIGSPIECINQTDVIMRGDRGIVVKILSFTENVLVHWERLNKIIWIPEENIIPVNSDVKEIPFISVHECIKDVTVSTGTYPVLKGLNVHSKEFWMHLELDPCYIVNDLSIVVTATIPGINFIVSGGDNPRSMKILSEGFATFGQSEIHLLTKNIGFTKTIEIKLLTRTLQLYQVVDLKLKADKINPDFQKHILSMFYTQNRKLSISESKDDELCTLWENSTNKQVDVFMWGLNDKDQLGGLKGSKVKSPTLCDHLSSLQCKFIAGGSKSTFFITNKGKLYSCGESSFGKLGIGDITGNVTSPRLVTGLNQLIVTKVSVHSGGNHVMALTSDGLAFSWGDGENGQLGHGNLMSCSKPHLIEAFVGKIVTDISCGSAHSAAIVENKYLYTWGLGDFGRLGHGDEETILQPKFVTHFLGYNVVQVSCGSRDAQTVCITDDDKVWSWGDGDFGKLGRGGSERCLIPVEVEQLRGLQICKILCGAQFTVALTKTGTVWTWGKGDFYRLGHGTDIHVRQPKLVEGLRGKHVIDIAVGALHCLAVTQDGEVFSWGDNDHGQLGTGETDVKKVPNLITGLHNHRIKYVACGSSHSIAWTEITTSACIIDKPLSFEVNYDPMATNLVKVKENDEVFVSGLSKFLKEQRPPLIRSVMQINSISLKEEVLKNIMYALEILLARSILCKLMEHSDGFLNRHYTNEEDYISQILKLYKLGLCGHLTKKNLLIIESYLKKECSKSVKLCKYLVDVCIHELDEKHRQSVLIQDKYKPIIQESPHPYNGAPGALLLGSVKYPGVAYLEVEFDPQCQIEAKHDVLIITDKNGKLLVEKTGDSVEMWSSKLKVAGDEINWKFTTNSPGGLWGFRFTVIPVIPIEETDLDCLSDEAVLEIPCLNFVKSLLGFGITSKVHDELVILKIISSLCKCITLKSANTKEKIWMLSKLHFLLLSHNAPPVDIPMIFNCSQTQSTFLCKVRHNGNQHIKEAVSQSPLSEFIIGVPKALLEQYTFEEKKIKNCDQLMFSTFLRTLALFACSLGLDSMPCCSDKQQWAWFSRYCTAVRTAHSFIQNTSLPKQFVDDVREKLVEILQVNESPSLDYEKHVFSKSEDWQLLTWMNRKSQDWNMIWAGAGTVYGWGHNHRGQLGGVSGIKVKSPVLCSAIAAIKPVQIIGGEQTFFFLNSDGKVFATGYGNNGQLGLGYSETVTSPRLLESIKHINIKKISVHSGGRHCLALSSDGEVFSWGEGEDGKLGHGNRQTSSQPKRIEFFCGKIITNICAGGSHSAAIGLNGELYTWGKGRYGRLGHGDSDDQLKPKQVEALQFFFVLDVACGSGDAQTLCITNDDNVWSWGDGDYGKLGRGGSDGCKVPMIIEDLSGKGIVKVECGSQFSMALTKYGVLYTWGKGDYYRLGHGTEEHVRRPMMVTALFNKIVTSISCGSLHCVVCTDEGEVYCWGDNDEGQLGDGTIIARQTPTLNTFLLNKKIDRISCGSAHTIAWSTSKASERRSLPLEVPVEYNNLKHLPMNALRDRAFLLNSFSKLICLCFPLLDLVPQDTDVEEPMINSLRRIILFSFKESIMRKVIESTSIRDQQHGPVVQLNRVVKHRQLRGSNINQSLFAQLAWLINEFPSDSFRLPNRMWKVKFVGESVDDCGGGFSESLAEICEELRNGSLPILLPTPNNVEENDQDYDCFMLNPGLKHPNARDLFRFFGILLGIAVRTGHPMSLNLAEPMWKLLVGSNITLEDIGDMDRGFFAKYSYLLTVKGADLEAVELPYVVLSAGREEIVLSESHKTINELNKMEYLKSALFYKQHEFDEIVGWIRFGMAQVIPVPVLSLFTGSEFETIVCGSPDIPVEDLRSLTSYKGIDPLSPLVGWFWRVLEDFTNHERSLFLRFVWGRTRLPRTHADFRGKDFIFQVLDKYNPPDEYLPESYTCFFLLKMPRYTNYETLKEKLKYAIYFCKSIDTDDYARIESANL
nr:E3 ubiquitin-protein ligase HERC2 isoform X1 [Hydra vulgaris]XP_047123877.1 E3 ubiquitin-protein ligase HERC2 isoform X2 [Hydra vulgaris]